MCLFTGSPEKQDSPTVYQEAETTRKQTYRYMLHTETLVHNWFCFLNYDIYMNVLLTRQQSIINMENLRFFILTVTILSLLGSGRACLSSYQYQDQNGVCQSCYYKCLTCQDSSQYCSSCISEYYLDAKTSTCQPCAAGCASCTNSSTCTLCVDGFYMNANGSCKACSVGAKTCSISIISACQTGYYLLSGICAKCISNCDSCSDSVTCTTCSSGYYAANSTSCMVCGSHCKTCTSNSCISCELGYNPITGSNTCTACNGSNMVYSQATGTCLSCPLNCESCDQSICYYCSTGYYLSADGQSCVAGGSLLCLQSLDVGYFNCKVDMVGCSSNSVQQYDSSSGTQVLLGICLPRRISSTSQYIFGYEPVCNTTSHFSYNIAASPSYKTTINIQINIYGSLPSSLSLNTVDNYGTSTTITLYIPSIVQSQSAITGTCGSYRVWNTVYQSSTSLVSFQLSGASIFVSQLYIEAFLCSVENCQKCSTNLDCTACITEYYLQMNKCLQSCDAGFYLYNSVCYVTCPAGTYAIQSQYTCVDCTNNCKTCANSTTCLSCNINYYLYGSDCVANCSTASANTTYAKDSICMSCPFPCLTCGQNNTTTICLSCSSGYLYGIGCVYSCPDGTYLNFGSVVQCSPCSSASPYFCASCSLNQTLCTSCVSPYLLYDAQCATSCPAGYVNVSYICKKCELPCLECAGTITNCTSCKMGSLRRNSSGFGICVSNCPDGFYSNYTDPLNVTCSSCNSACSTCYGASASQCTSCSISYFLQDSTCGTTCSVNTTYQDSSLNRCSSCLTPCLTCKSTNGSACTSCLIGFLGLSQCNLVCSSSEYALLTGTLYACTTCPSTCSACKSATSCSSCVSPYLLFNQWCISPSNCPAGYYNDTIFLKCSPCTTPCATCNNSAIKCLSCVSGALFVLDLKYCVDTCPSGFYASGSQCLACSTNCSECYGTSTNCTKCSFVNSNQLYLYSNDCLATCPNNYFADSTTTSCLVCISPCKQCYNAYYCKSCLDTTLALLNKTCVQTCPSKTISTIASNSTLICDACTSHCATCNTITSNCTTCESSYYYYVDSSNLGICSLTCQSGYYGDVLTSLCTACTSPCATCTSYSACLTCVSGYSLYQKRCYTTCPDGYYSSSQVCVACASPCSHCTSETTCTQCASGFYMPFGVTSNQGCLTSCPNGYYGDDFLRQCSECGSNCAKCTNQSTCLNCTNSTSLHVGYCFQSCPTGYYSNQSVCTLCPSGCTSCWSSTNCSHCITNYYLYNGGCLSSCSSGTFASIDVIENNNICVSCAPNCLICTGYYTCLSCNTSFLLQNGFCKSNCTTFFYKDANTCRACSTNCISCIDSNTCSSCFSSYLYNSSCHIQCPNITYSVASTLTCELCIQPCFTCTNQYACTSCITGYVLYQSYCITGCPTNTWFMISDGSCVVDCPYLKDYSLKYCYTVCPKYQVAYKDTCLDSCPDSYYVSADQVCTECSGTVCQQLFKAQMQILKTDSFTLWIYFNQKSQILRQSDVYVIFSTLSASRRLQTTLTEYAATDRAVKMVFDMPSQELITVSLKIPYLKSQDSSQSLYINTFTKNIYQYQQWPKTPDLSSFSMILGVLVIILFAVNLIVGSGHYQQIIQLGQILHLLKLLEVDYSYALSTFLHGFKILTFSAQTDFAAPYIYSFSSPKFIYYMIDSNFLRHSTLILVWGAIIGAIFVGVAIYVYIKRNESKELQESHCLLRRLRQFYRRMRWRHLNDYFYVGMTWAGVTAACTFANSPNSYTISTYAISVIALLVIVIAVVFLFYIVLTALRKKKRKLQEEISGLVEDLQTNCSTLGLMYTPFIYLRKILLIVVIGAFSNQPIYAISLLLVMSILILVALIFYKPFQNDISDYMSILLEASIVITLFMIALLATNQNSFSLQVKSGLCFFIIAINSAAYLVGFVWWSYQTAVTRVIPFLTQSSAPEVVSTLHEYGKAGKDNGMQINEEQYKDNLRQELDKMFPINMDHEEANSANDFNVKSSSGSNSEKDDEEKEQFNHWNASESNQSASDKEVPELLMKREAVRSVSPIEQQEPSQHPL